MGKIPVLLGVAGGSVEREGHRKRGRQGPDHRDVEVTLKGLSVGA